jgi:anti-sigma factor RsiW
MKCDQVRETLPDLAAGSLEPSAEMREHLQACAPCAERLQEFRQTMALLDTWEAPEPSAYFDTRLQARLRGEKIAEAARGTGWFGWMPRPMFAMAAALLLVAGIGIFTVRERGNTTSGVAVNVSPKPVEIAPRGTAVGDLQTLDSDNDLYANFDVLDDIDTRQDPPASE